MQRVSIRFIILVTILIIFSISVVFIEYIRSSYRINTNLSGIPLIMGEWSGKELEVNAETKAILQTNFILSREYRKGRDRIFLVVIYYVDNRVSLYLPHSWFEEDRRIISKDIKEINVSGEGNFIINRLILKNGKMNQEIVYYFETKAERTNIYSLMRWRMMLNRLKSKNSSGALVRISSPITQNIVTASKLLENFIKQASPLISEQLFEK